MYRQFIKPLFDFVVALIALLLLSPVILLITIVLFFSNNGKPFFFQQRTGKKGKLFYVIKFKTMNDRRDSDGRLLPDAERLSVTGRFIRKTSLDELPQLINILKGEMSLIGPRPLLPAYLPLYNRFQNRRHEVMPGITGWAQVNGRNAISWQKKFECDVYYVERLSFLLDMKILFLTFAKVLKSEGISAEGSATMEPFRGNNV